MECDGHEGKYIIIIIIIIIIVNEPMTKASEAESERTETCLNENYINPIKVRCWARQWPRFDARLGSGSGSILD